MRTIKFFSLIFCAALFLSCSADFECLHCKEDFFENAALSSSSNAVSSSSSSSSSDAAISSSSDLNNSSSSDTASSSSESDPYLLEPDNYEAKIVKSKMWMTENLKKGGCSELPLQDDWHCAMFGRLYSRNEVANACTGDWRLPTYGEFEEYLDNGGEIDLPGYWNGNEIEGIGSYGIWFVAEGEIIQVSGEEVGEFINDSSPANFYSIRCIGKY